MDCVTGFRAKTSTSFMKHWESFPCESMRKVFVQYYENKLLTLYFFFAVVVFIFWLFFFWEGGGLFTTRVTPLKKKELKTEEPIRCHVEQLIARYIRTRTRKREPEIGNHPQTSQQCSRGTGSLRGCDDDGRINRLVRWVTGRFFFFLPNAVISLVVGSGVVQLLSVS